MELCVSRDLFIHKPGSHINEEERDKTLPHVCAMQLPGGSGIYMPFEVGIQTHSLQVNIEYSKFLKFFCRILIFHPDY